MRRVRAYIGLGANMGDAPDTLARAVRALAALPGVRLRGVSRLYVTRPVGVLDQPDFHNAVVALDVPAGPDPETGALALLIALKGLERAFGRQERERWGPRELDLDLLLFGRHRVRVERPDAARSADPGAAGVAVAGGAARLRAGTPLRAGAAGRPRAGPRSAGMDGDRRDGAPAVALGGPRRVPRARGTGAAGPVAEWTASAAALWLAASGCLRLRTGATPRAQRPDGAAGGSGRTCGPCPRSGPAWPGRPSPASACGRRRRRSGRR